MEDYYDNYADDIPNWGSPATNDDFAYDDILYFDLETDPIEACSVDDDTKKQELLDILVSRSTEYNVPVETPDVSYGSLRAQMASM